MLKFRVLILLFLSLACSVKSMTLIDIASTVRSDHTFNSSYKNAQSLFTLQQKTEKVSSFINSPFDYNVYISYTIPNEFNANANMKYYLYDGGVRKQKIQQQELKTQSELFNLINTGRSLLNDVFNMLINYWNIYMDMEVLNHSLKQLPPNEKDPFMMLQLKSHSLNKSMLEEELKNFGLTTIPVLEEVIWPDFYQEASTILDNLSSSPNISLGYSIYLNRLEQTKIDISSNKPTLYLSYNFLANSKTNNEHVISLMLDWNFNSNFLNLSTSMQAKPQQNAQLRINASKQKYSNIIPSIKIPMYSIEDDIQKIKHKLSSLDIMEQKLHLDRSQLHRDIKECSTYQEVVTWITIQRNINQDKLSIIRIGLDLLVSIGYFDSIF